jgi:hypothetical protein
MAIIHLPRKSGDKMPQSIRGIKNSSPFSVNLVMASLGGYDNLQRDLVSGEAAYSVGSGVSHGTQSLGRGAEYDGTSSGVIRQYISSDYVNAAPLSMASWVYRTSTTAEARPLSLHPTGTANNPWITLGAQAAADEARFVVRTGPTYSSATVAAGAGTMMLAGVAESSTVRKIYVNGAYGASSSTDNINPADLTIERSVSGILDRSSVVTSAAGSIVYSTMLWSERAMDAAELAALYSPTHRWDWVDQGTRRIFLPTSVPVVTSLTTIPGPRKSGSRAPVRINGINWASPLAKGLVSAVPFFGTLGARDYVSNKQLSLLGTGGDALTPFSDVGHVLDTHATARYASQPTFSAPQTGILISFWTHVQASIIGSPWAFQMGADENNRISAHIPWTDDVAYWDYGGNGGFATGQRETADFTNYLGIDTHVVLWAAGTGGSGEGQGIQFNGVVAASNENTGTVSATPSGQLIGSGFTVPDDNNQAYMWDFRVWDRPHNDEFRKALYNPQTRWDIYSQGTRRIFLPAPPPVATSLTTIPRPRAAQALAPQVIMGINHSHSFSRGIYDSWRVGEVTQRVSDGTTQGYTEGSGMSRYVSRVGVGSKRSGVNNGNGYINIETRDGGTLTHNGGYTVVALMDVVPSALIQGIVDDDDSITGGAVRTLQFRVDADERVRAINWLASGAISANFPSTTVVTAGVHVIAMRAFDSGEVSIWIDGAKESGTSTMAGAAAPLFSNGKLRLFNRKSWGYTPSSSAMFGVHVYQEPISDSALKGMGTPEGFWSVYNQGTRRIFLSGAAAAQEETPLTTSFRTIVRPVSRLSRIFLPTIIGDQSATPPSEETTFSRITMII